MTCVIQKQDVPTLMQSQNLVQNLLGTSIGTIAYLRHFLPEDHFADVVVGGVKVKAIKKNASGKANALLKWLDGCFEALQKRYLESVVFGLFRDPDVPQKFVESYHFKFEYSSENEQVEMVVSNTKKNSSTSTEKFSKKDIMKATSEMLRRLVIMTQNMEKIPDDCYLTMKLFYVPGVPEDYEPPCFKAAEEEEDDDEPMKQNKSIDSNERVEIGQVDTNHHRVQFVMKTSKEREFDSEGIKNENLNDEVIVPDSQIISIDHQMKKMKLQDKKNKKTEQEFIPTQRASFMVESSQQGLVPEMGSTQDIIQTLYQGKPEIFEASQVSTKDDIQMRESQHEHVDKRDVDFIPESELTETCSDISKEKRINCICGSFEDENIMVQCDKCGKWGHMPCLGFAAIENIPETFKCYDCKDTMIDENGLQEIALMRRTLWLIWNEGMKSKERLAGKLYIDSDALDPIIERLRSLGILKSIRGRYTQLKVVKNKRTKDAFNFYFSSRCEEEMEESEERGRTKKKQVSKKRKVSIARDSVKI